MELSIQPLLTQELDVFRKKGGRHKVATPFFATGLLEAVFRHIAVVELCLFVIQADFAALKAKVLASVLTAKPK